MSIAISGVDQKSTPQAMRGAERSECPTRSRAKLASRVLTGLPGFEPGFAGPKPAVLSRLDYKPLKLNRKRDVNKDC